MLFNASTLLAKIALAAMLGSGALAAPWPQSAKHSTHSIRSLQSGVKLESYHPESKFETFGTRGLDHPLRKRADVSTEGKVKAFLADKLSVKEDDVVMRAGFKGDTAEYTWVRQAHAGIPFANAGANVAMDLDGKVLSFGQSFVKPTKMSPSTPKLSKEEAIAAAEKSMGASFNDQETQLNWVMKADNTASLAHVVQVQNDESDTFGEAFVDAQTGEVLAWTDFISHATFRVLPIQKQLPDEGFETLVDPEDKTASPFGWLRTSANGVDATSSQGNNAAAFVGNAATQASAADSFVFQDDQKLDPRDATNPNAAITNAFYLTNTIHDISYLYGFTEKAFNFQQTQTAAGGLGNDRVLVSVQDASGVNNANFASPPDGQSGQMRMFLWNLANPLRDGALENDIVVHEFTHGITNRMTGGGSGRCLQTTEAGGMGEGWSDAMSFWTEQKSADVKDYIMGQFVTNSAKGIRSAPYSTNPAVNKLRFSSIAALNEVHNIGEVWANMLINVYAALVADLGFDADARTNPNGKGGNTVFLHVMMDGLSLQPCNPTFVSARDAIIQADANRFAGANECTIRKAFAAKGLGSKAANFVDDDTVPAKCA